MTDLGYVKDLNLRALADFTALHATNDHCPIFNCINGARTGFSLNIRFCFMQNLCNFEFF